MCPMVAVMWSMWVVVGLMVAFILWVILMGDE